jgi:sensor histidine kinase YesM
VLEGGDAGDGHPHIGLANTRERVAALYGERARLELTNPPEGGALVRLRVPRQGEADRD